MTICLVIYMKKSKLGRAIRATAQNARAAKILGVFEEFADYILGTEFRIGSVFLLLVLILVYRRFKLSRKREYLK